MALRN